MRTGSAALAFVISSSSLFTPKPASTSAFVGGPRLGQLGENRQVREEGELAEKQAMRRIRPTSHRAAGDNSGFGRRGASVYLFPLERELSDARRLPSCMAATTTAFPIGVVGPVLSPL